MKQLFIVCTLLLLVVTNQARAQTPTEAQMWRLVQSSGIQEQMEAQREILAKQNKKAIGGDILCVTQSPHMNEEMRDFIREEVEHFLTEADKAFDTETISRDYARLMREKLSDEEVEELIAWHETALAKKYVQANTAITAPWMEKSAEDYDQQILMLMQEFSASLTGKLIKMQQEKKENNES